MDGKVDKLFIENSHNPGTFKQLLFTLRSNALMIIGASCFIFILRIFAVYCVHLPGMLWISITD
jgi:hypothetical protein